MSIITTIKKERYAYRLCQRRTLSCLAGGVGGSPPCRGHHVYAIGRQRCDRCGCTARALHGIAQSPRLWRKAGQDGNRLRTTLSISPVARWTVGLYVAQMGAQWGKLGISRPLAERLQVGTVALWLGEGVHSQPGL